MRISFPIAAALALAALVSPAASLAALATAAAVLFESTPFLLIGFALERADRLRPWGAYLGCGCGTGPSARSLPAAAMASLTVGPLVAAARVLAATLAARVLRAHECRHDGPATLLHDLRALAPAALLCGAASQLLPLLDLSHCRPAYAILAGALFGFFAAPCGLGSIAVAATLRATAPLAADAFLCVAGIADVRAFARAPHAAAPRNDALGYAILGTACAVVAWRRGDALVHPAMTIALAIAAVATFATCVAHRRSNDASVRLAPALMLAAALAAAPPPVYRASETTMGDLFAGERWSSTGRLTRGPTGDTLVRYAILCCRADAAPVAVRLSERLKAAPDSWVAAEGTVVDESGRFALRVANVTAIAPPADPFLYR